MLLLALALAPAIAIICYILAKDKYNREPFKNLFISFLLGALSTIPAIILEFTLTRTFTHVFGGQSILYYALLAFAIVGLSEEGCKFVMLRYYAYPKKAFDEPLDGIIYGVMVSMGFATVENIMYVFEHGIGTGIVRMFLSVPAHGCFGVIMGYYVGLAKFDHQRMRQYMQTGLWLAILFHGSFDFFLFLEASGKPSLLPAGLLTFGALYSFMLAVRLSRRSIKLHQELSRIEYEKSKRDDGWLS